MSAIEVEDVKSGDEHRVIGALVDAFMADPAARSVYLNSQRYLEHFPAFIRGFGGRAFETNTVHCTGTCQGVSLWLPPGVHPDDEAVSDLIRRSVPERKQGAAFAFFAEMRRYHPSVPHWHMPLIGVHTETQGKGYGSALLYHVLQQCDAERTLAYLESSNVRNIRLYQRHGFEVLGTIQIGTSPPITPMLRLPH